MSRFEAGAASRPSFRRDIRLVLGAAAFCLAAGVAQPARATDFEVSGESAFQAYDVTGPWGDVVLERRRYMQTLGLAAYNLQGESKPGQADYKVLLKMRLDSDFGINGNLPDAQAGGETTFRTASGEGVRYVPGLSSPVLDLMYGYVEGRNLAHGWFGFKLGRQYMTDMLGWWAFDGGLVRLTTPYFIQAEIYGGLEERGGLPLSTSHFEQQGVWRGSHSAFGTPDGPPSAADYPSYQFAEPAPAFGFAIESNGPSFVHGRFDYRRVYNTGESITQQFPDAQGGYRTIDGTRLSSDRIGYALDASKSDLGGLKGGFSYDLYGQNVVTYYAGIEARLGKKLTLGADLDYYAPVFDADSIWNWFTHSPITTITGRTAIRFSKEFDVSASGGVRLWTTDGDPTTFNAGQCAIIGQPPGCNATAYADPQFYGIQDGYTRIDANRGFAQSVDALANLGGRYKFRTAQIDAKGMLETGERGHRVGGDVAGEKKFDGGRFTLGGRTSLYDWDDPLRPDRSATSFTYVVAGGFRPARLADFRVEWEHDINRLVGQRFRVVALVNLLVLK